MRLRVRIIAVMFSSLGLAPARGAPATQPVKEAIVGLGDRDPAVRDRAEKYLRDAGDAAHPALQAAARDPDSETAVRARAILRLTAIPAPPISTHDDAAEPSIIRYRASAPAAKRDTISNMSSMLGGVRALAELWLLETDPELRAAIFQELRQRPAEAASALLSAGNVASAELLLQSAVDKKEPGAISSYVAYCLCRRTLDDAIRRWSARGAHDPADAWAEEVLSALYRAKGDAASALRYAQASDDRLFIRQTRLWSGDWAPLAADVRNDHAGAQNWGSLSFLAALDVAANDSKSLDIDLAALKALAPAQASVHLVSNVLTLAGKPDEGAAFCVSSREYAAAYEQFMARDRFDEAAALLADHDADASPAAVLLRCAAAKLLARNGKISQATSLIERVAADMGPPHAAGLDLALAEAEREAGMTERAWKRLADGAELLSRGTARFSYVAFPPRGDTVDWNALWYAAQIQNPNRPRTPRQVFDRIRRAYDRSMPIEELMMAIDGVDLSSTAYRPYVGLAWEAAQRMIEAGNEAEGIKFAEQCAAQSPDGELYVDLGDRAALSGDWAGAASRYAAAWHKDPSQPLPLYLNGLALLRCGQATDGRELILLARLLPLGNDYLREELMRGLALRGFDDAAAAEANILILTGQFLSRPVDIALRIAAGRDGEHGQFAAAAGLLQRSVLNFTAGALAFPEPSMNLYLAASVSRARARDLLAHGQWEAARRQVKACYDLLPGDIEVAIDLVPDLEKLGKKNEADALFAECYEKQQKLCIRFPDSANQHNQIAWLAAKCDRQLDAALEHARRAVELMPKRTSYIDTLAEVYFMRGQYDEAIVEMKKCVAIEPMVWRHRRQIERFEAKKAAPNQPAKATPSSLE
ncbi:MAG TPA: hypothetical protein VG326_12350 [Tepidisphaeraceae bacterium]|nr:hypothetical protein [Tepidisphaeraceae bacterium]